MNEIMLESMSRAVGYGGWSLVTLGVTLVIIAIAWGGRRSCGIVTMPVGDERRVITRSRGERLGCAKSRPLAGVWGQRPQGLDRAGVRRR